MWTCELKRCLSSCSPEWGSDSFHNWRTWPGATESFSLVKLRRRGRGPTEQIFSHEFFTHIILAWAPIEQNTFCFPKQGSTSSFHKQVQEQIKTHVLPSCSRASVLSFTNSPHTWQHQISFQMQHRNIVHGLFPKRTCRNSENQKGEK
jgi:hypothetical protein